MGTASDDDRNGLRPVFSVDSASAFCAVHWQLGGLAQCVTLKGYLDTKGAYVLAKARVEGSDRGGSVAKSERRIIVKRSVSEA